MSNPWSGSELIFLIENYETQPNELIAESLHRTPVAIQHMLSHLGLKRLSIRESKHTASELSYIDRRIHDAVKRGDLTKTGCVVCGYVPAQAHHEDYDRPLDVIWLCPKHHQKLHALRELGWSTHDIASYLFDI